MCYANPESDLSRTFNLLTLSQIKRNVISELMFDNVNNLIEN